MKWVWPWLQQFSSFDRKMSLAQKTLLFDILQLWLAALKRFDPREKLSLWGLWDEDKTQRNSVSALKVTPTLQLGKLKHPSYQIVWKAKRIYTPHHGEVTAYQRLIVLPDYSILRNSHQHNSSYKTSPSAFKINAKSLKGSWVENIWAVMRK